MQPIFPAIVTLLLVVYAWARRALTYGGILAAIVTAGLTAFHPWGTFFSLLVVFFLAGTLTTKLAHRKKSTLVAANPKDKAHAEPRTATQVLANSAPMTLMAAAHGLYMHFRLAEAPEFLISMPEGSSPDPFWFPPVCLSKPTASTVGFNEFVGAPGLYYSLMNTLPYAIVAGYCAVAADTFASELGMYAGGRPYLITSLLKGRLESVPPGTNGGITIGGVLASALGSAIIAGTAISTLPLCQGTLNYLDVDETRAAFLGQYLGEGPAVDLKRWADGDKLYLFILFTIAGVLGGLLDSWLGAVFQASYVDSRGKIIEGEGGVKVAAVGPRGGERKLVTGSDTLSNNAVNFVMALVTCVATVGVMRVVTA